MKFPLRLPFIRPYSTCRNWEHSLQSCFVLRGDSAPGCLLVLDSPFLPSHIKWGLQTATNHCFITHCGFPAAALVEHVLLLIVDWTEWGRHSRPRRPVRSGVAHISAQVWWGLPKHLTRRRERKRIKEGRIKSYLYVATAFCWQSASKASLPCPLSPCQIVIEPSWKSKTPPASFCLFLNSTDIHACFILKGGKKKYVFCHLGALRRCSTEQTELHSTSAHLLLNRLYSLLKLQGAVEG